MHQEKCFDCDDLTSAKTIEAYGYDANGNRTSSDNAAGHFDATVDAQDRLLTYGTLTFNYNANGDLVSTTNAGIGETTTYTYDAMGNLREAVLPDGRDITYLVDGLGRRVGKRVNGVFERGWLWRGQLQVVAETNSTNAVVKRFVYSDGTNVPELMVTATGTYRFVKDHLGSVRRVLNAESGVELQRLQYDSWGRILSDTSPSFQPFGFAGGLYDSDTHLERFGSRDYDPNNGVWLRRDAPRFIATSSAYAYCNGDPMNLRDATGRYAVAPVAVAAATTVLGGPEILAVGLAGLAVAAAGFEAGLLVGDIHRDAANDHPDPGYRQPDPIDSSWQRPQPGDFDRCGNVPFTKIPKCCAEVCGGALDEEGNLICSDDVSGNDLLDREKCFDDCMVSSGYPR